MDNIDKIVTNVLNEMNAKDFFDNYVHESADLSKLVTDDINNLIWNIECLKVLDILGINSNVDFDELIDILEKNEITDNIVYDENTFENIRYNLENYFKSDNVELFNKRMSILIDKKLPLNNFISLDDLKKLSSENILKYINSNESLDKSVAEIFIKLGFPQALEKVPEYDWFNLYGEDSLMKIALDNGYDNYDYIFSKSYNSNVKKEIINSGLIEKIIANGYDNYDLLIGHFSKTNMIDYIISNALSNGYKNYDKIYEVYSDIEMLEKIKNGTDYLIEPFLKKITSSTVDNNVLLEFLITITNNQNKENNILDFIISNSTLRNKMIENYDKFTNLPKNVYEFLKYENQNNKKLTEKSILINNLEDINKYFTDEGLDKSVENDLYYIDLSNTFDVKIDEIDSLNTSNTIKNYLKFMKKTYNVFFKEINTLEKVNKYFSEPINLSEIFERALFDENLFSEVFKRGFFDYNNYYKPIPEVKNYIDFVIKYGFILNDIKNVLDINNYFTKNGPTIEFYEKALFDKKLFNILYEKDDYNYKNNDEISDAEKSFVELIKVNDFNGLEKYNDVEKIKEKFNSKENIKNVIKDLFEHNLFKSMVLLDIKDIEDLFINSNMNKSKFFYYLSCNIEIIDKYRFNENDLFVKTFIELLSKNEMVDIDVDDKKIDCSFLASSINYFNKIDTQKYPVIQDIKNKINQIEKEYGKIGIINQIDPLKTNACISMNFINYVYPFLEKNKSILNIDLKDILKYESNAYNEIANEIKNDNEKILISYYLFVRDNNIFNDDRCFHFAFRYFSRISNLIKQIDFNMLKNNPDAIKNIKTIILNGNIFEVENYDQIVEYNSFVSKKIVSSSDKDIDEFKTLLSRCFGFYNYEEFKNIFETFQIDNFAKRDYISSFIPNMDDSLQLTNIELSVIIIAREIIKTNNKEELKKLLSNASLVDYTSIFENILLKTRKLYSAQFNARLTKDLEGKNNVIDNGDYKIIDYDKCSFNFLAHRIYSFDPKYADFAQKLINNPELWDKLDGASTLSTSTISDKGFWMINNSSNNGLVYLFNDLPEDFLLYMYGKDLFVEHGGHKLTPNSRYNFFTDLDSINQACAYSDLTYNEVAGFREGMRPCAIACVGDEPTDVQITAAKYFNIPIIRFNTFKYNKKRNNEYKKAVESFNNNPEVETLHKIFYSGDIENIQNFSEMFNNYFKLIDKLDVDIEKKYKLVEELRNCVDRLCDTYNPDREIFLTKSSLYIYILEYSMLKNKSAEFKNADMGESGIMYNEKNEMGEYLIKPAVDKKEYQIQNFRAEIQKSASVLQKIISPDTYVYVDVSSIKNDNNETIKLSRQEKVNMTETGKNYLVNWEKNPSDYPLSKKQINQLLQEYVVDYLLCNFDCFAGNFVIDVDGNVRGIDKEQSFRFINDEEALNKEFNYNPNGLSRVPIYSILFERCNNGEIDIDFDYLNEVLSRVNNISDEQYKQIFIGYAKDLDPVNYEEILDAIVERKNICLKNIVEFVEHMKKNNEVEMSGGIRR